MEEAGPRRDHVSAGGVEEVCGDRRQAGLGSLGESTVCERRASAGAGRRGIGRDRKGEAVAREDVKSASRVIPTFGSAVNTMTHEPARMGPGAAVLDAADRLLRHIEFATVVVAGIVIFLVMWVGVAEIFSR